jgi:type IV pilus assembly protein PilM
MGLFSSRQVLGLDIGSSTVKAMVLSSTKKGHTLVNLGYESLPPEVIVDGEIMDSAVIIDAIQKILRHQKFKAKETCVGLSGHSVIVKRIPLPRMTADELEESIQWEAEQYIPFDIEEVNIDFQILDSPESGGEDSANMDVVIVAVKKNKIDEILNLITQSGLTPSVIDIDGFALGNQHEINFGIEDGVTALVNIGASIMNINIVENGVHMLHRDISIGGNQFTDAIQKELDVNYNQAEGLKMGEELKGIDPRAVTRIVSAVNEDVSLEIQRSFDYYRSVATSDQIDRIMLTGGSARIKGLDSYLAERLGVVVELGDPIRSLRYNERKFDPDYLNEMSLQLGVVVGLAMRYPGDKAK